MNTTNMANTYKNQQIMTATPEELTLILYNGAIRFVGESLQAIERGDLQKSHNSNVRAQEIVREFMVTLNMEYEISQELYKLYEYIEYCLIQGNIQKNKEQLKEANNMLHELRDTWHQAMKQVRGKLAVGK